MDMSNLIPNFYSRPLETVSNFYSRPLETVSREKKEVESPCLLDDEEIIERFEPGTFLILHEKNPIGSSDIDRPSPTERTDYAVIISTLDLKKKGRQCMTLTSERSGFRHPESVNKHSHIWGKYRPEIDPEGIGIPQRIRDEMYARAIRWLYENYHHVALCDRTISLPPNEKGLVVDVANTLPRLRRKKLFLPLGYQWDEKWGHIGFKCSPCENNSLHPGDVYCEAIVPLYWKIFTFFTTRPDGCGVFTRDFAIIDDNDVVMARIYLDEEFHHVGRKEGTIYASHVDFPTIPPPFDPVGEICQYILDRKNGKRLTQFKTFKISRW